MKITSSLRRCEMKKIILGLVLFVSAVAFADGIAVIDFPEGLSSVLVHPDFAAAVEKAQSSLVLPGEELVLKQASVTDTEWNTTEVRISLVRLFRPGRIGEVPHGEIVGQVQVVGGVREVSVFFKPAAEPPSGNR